MTKELDQYQQEALKFFRVIPSKQREYLCMGLASEVGEVMDLLKKHIRDDLILDRNALRLELGDVLWYLSQLCQYYGMDLSDVAGANLEKLERRHNKGIP